MATVFSQQGNTFLFREKEAMMLTEQLPSQTMAVRWNDTFKYYFLEITDGFKLPAKRYGDNDQMADRVLNTFAKRAKATGMLLAGEKGSGKSLLAKTVAVKALEKGMPVLLVNENHTGPEFFKTIQSIEQPAIVLFDEFEKIYDRDAQKEVLTLLDGMFPSNKLYIFTVNDKWAIDPNMHNRPGRIFYAIDYAGLSAEFIREYCNDNLKNKKRIDSVVKLGGVFTNFNFDMLQALVEEMNRYNESAAEALKYLNIKAEHEDMCSYDYKVQVPGKPDDFVISDDDEFRGVPLARGARVSVRVYNKKPDSKGANYDYLSCMFEPSHMVSVDPGGKKLVFVNDKNEQLTLTRKTRDQFGLSKFVDY